MADELPAELFMRRGAWFIVKLPTPEHHLQFVERVVRFKGDSGIWAAIFTSEKLAREYAHWTFPDTVADYCPFAFDAVNYTGGSIELLGHSGCPYVAVNPEVGYAPELRPAADVAGEIERYVMPHGSNPN
jgi:hypothetical protein